MATMKNIRTCSTHLEAIMKYHMCRPEKNRVKLKIEHPHSVHKRHTSGDGGDGGCELQVKERKLPHCEESRGQWERKTLTLQ